MNSIQDCENEFIRCPQSSCNKKYLVSDFMKILPSRHNQCINDCLAKKYCQNASDIRSCPNSGCGNYGFFNNEICNKSLICTECNREWDDYNLYDLKKRTIRNFKKRT